MHNSPTPAPWFFDQSPRTLFNGIPVYSIPKAIDAQPFSGFPLPVAHCFTKADAALVSAAPEMLYVLRELCNAIDNNQPPNLEYYRFLAVSVIAKAETF
jgi:hypothetical protein